MKKYEFSAEQISELELAHKAAQDSQQALRLGILCLRVHGDTYEDIHKQTGISISAAEELVRRYKKGGVKAILSMRTKRRQFTPQEIAEVKAAYDDAMGEWERRRLEVIYLYVQGETHQKIKEITGLGMATISRLSQDYCENGIKSMLERMRSFRRMGKVRRNYFTPEQTAELKNAYKTATNPKTVRRLEALLQLSEGENIEDAAASFGYSASNLYWLKQQFLEGGPAAIFRMEHRKKQPFIAHKHKFTPKQKAEIEAARKTVAYGSDAVRLEALWMRVEEKSLPDISTAVGLHVSNITKIIRNYQEGGLEAVIGTYDKRAKSHQYMSREEEVAVLEQLRHETEKGAVLARPQIMEAFEKALGHSVNRCWIGHVLGRNHWKWHGHKKGWLPHRH